MSSVVLPEPLGPIRPEDLAGSHLDVDAGERGDALEALRDLRRPAAPAPRARSSTALDRGVAGLLRRRARRSAPPSPLARRLPGGTGARRSSISQRSKMPSGRRISVMMMSNAIANCTVPVTRGSSHGPDRDALLDAGERVGEERDDRRARDRAGDRRPAADHQHREQRERDREVELVRVERDHALGPQRAGGAHHRGAQQPRRRSASARRSCPPMPTTADPPGWRAAAGPGPDSL